MEREIVDWRKKYVVEEKKGDRLREQISRTEKELYSILQKKYELMRGPGNQSAGPGLGSGLMRGAQSRDSSRQVSYDDIPQV